MTMGLGTTMAMMTADRPRSSTSMTWLTRPLAGSPTMTR